jgi:hypothetical protein
MTSSCSTNQIRYFQVRRSSSVHYLREIKQLFDPVAASGNLFRVFITKLEYNNITKKKKLHEVL